MVLAFDAGGANPEATWYVQTSEPPPDVTPEQFSAYVKSEYDRYAKLIPELGIKGQQ
jgi:tripartite-type tricarboxylate transporter receptor subunit TctC